MRTTLTIADLNRMPQADFVAALGDLFEHAPWVAERAAAERPFGSADALHDAMMACVRAVDTDEQRRLFAAHPDLGPASGAMTAASTSEQGRLGFTTLSRAEHDDLIDLNVRYRARFGFPCIIALWRYDTRESVLAEMHRRLDADGTDEYETTLREIGYVTQARLAARLGP